LDRDAASPRTRKPDGTYGNLYSTCSTYVVLLCLIFYALTIAGIFLLRKNRPQAERPYRAFGYSVCSRAVYCAALAIMFVLLLYKRKLRGRGSSSCLLGVPCTGCGREKSPRHDDFLVGRRAAASTMGASNLAATW